MKKIKIFIAGTNTLIREGIKSIISQQKEMQIVGEINDSEELGDAIEKTNPDVIIIDFHIPNHLCLEDIVFLRRNFPQMNILIISTNQTIQDVLYIIDIGVRGYLLKECDKDEIISAIFSIAKNENFFCSKVVDIILEKHITKKETINTSNLTHREFEIVQLFADKHTAKQIADKLFLSHHTINTHRKNILKKLKVNSTTELVLYAIQVGIISPKNQ